MVYLYSLLIGLCCGTGKAEAPNAVRFAPVSELSVTQADTAKQTATAKKSKKKRRERKPAAAGVTMKRNITRASITQHNTEGYNIEILIMDGGLPIRNPEELQLIGSSGSTVSGSSYLGFDNVVFPFEGNIRFKSPSKMKAVTYDRVVSFKVTEPGRWVMRIDI